MTHSGGKPHEVGDRGQRYEIRATGWPTEGESVIGWSHNLPNAQDMTSAARKAPGCVSTVIFDRETQKLFPVDYTPLAILHVVVS